MPAVNCTTYISDTPRTAFHGDTHFQQAYVCYIGNTDMDTPCITV